MSIIFNGKSSTDFGIICQYYPDDATPSLKCSTVSVAGRNGDLHFSEHSYSNVQRRYSVYLSAETIKFARAMRMFTAWLNSVDGYAKLQDDYDPEVFRMARYLGGTDVEDAYNKFGMAEVEFDCKPQKFLCSGEDIVVDPSTIENPTYNEARPLIELTLDLEELTDDTTINFNGNLFTISEDLAETSQNHIYIDSEIYDMYSSTRNLNGFCSGDFPVLVQGENTISYDDDVITEMKLKPRWWVL